VAQAETRQDEHPANHSTRCYGSVGCVCGLSTTGVNRLRLGLDI
jgi:hypothetical protein